MARGEQTASERDSLPRASGGCGGCDAAPPALTKSAGNLAAFMSATLAGMIL
ncbi:MAG: hypothetical protein LJF15_20095 [Acidobacteria bacterium]|nr:hypothetical protein [Acidobacteriota bacterium]